MQSLNLVFSGTALALFRDRGLSPTQSALYAAHWTLLSGQLAGTIRLFPQSPAFLHCYTHYHREISGYFSDNQTEPLVPLECPSSQDIITFGRTIEEAYSLRNGQSGLQ